MYYVFNVEITDYHSRKIVMAKQGLPEIDPGTSAMRIRILSKEHALSRRSWRYGLDEPLIIHRNTGSIRKPLMI